MSTDNINHPPHYGQGEIECIDAIYSATGKEGAEAYLQGNIIKYLWRYKHRNGLEDLKKAQWYLNAMIELVSDESEDSNISYKYTEETKIIQQEEFLYQEMKKNWEKWGTIKDTSIHTLYRKTQKTWNEFRIKHLNILRDKHRQETQQSPPPPEDWWKNQ